MLSRGDIQPGLPIKNQEERFFFLDETILHDITRKSVLELAPELGLPVEERRIAIEEVIDGTHTGKLTEIFGAGTAAVISPVGKIAFQGRNHMVNGNQTGPWAQKFFATLTGIQYGEIEDKHDWVFKVK